MRLTTALILAIVYALFLHPTYALEPTQLEETRYCGEPKRNTAGTIIRSAAVRAAFQRIHPCPVNAAPQGACPGWQVDHVIPLACGGCDAVANMQWLPVALKITSGVGKDRWERLIYAGHIATESCAAPPLVKP